MLVLSLFSHFNIRVIYYGEIFFLEKEFYKEFTLVGRMKLVAQPLKP